METPEERLTKAREIYDHHIMVEMLAHAHVSHSPCHSVSPVRWSLPFSELFQRFPAARAIPFAQRMRTSGLVSGTFKRNRNRHLS